MDSFKLEEKILNNIDKLNDNIKELEVIELTEKEKESLSRAKDYLKDCEYYLRKDDEITSFECISYSHGLVDTLRMIHDLI